jgi:hypothetical protein
VSASHVYAPRVNFRSAILAFTCLLMASVFTIYYLGTKEGTDAFMEGTPIKATIVKIKKGRRPGVMVSYVDKGKTVEAWSELADELDLSSLKPGKVVSALRHRRSPSRVAIKRAVIAAEPSPLLFLGTAGFLALGVYVLFLPKIRAARRAKRTSGLDVIVDALSRTRTTSLVIGGGIAAFGASMIWLGASGADRTASAGTNIGVGVFGGFTVLVGLFILRMAWQLRSIRGSWIMEVIERRPGEIAWIYQHVVRSVAAPDASATYNVHMWFADGKSYSIAVEREDAEALLDELSRRAPHAAVGYSPEIEQLYRDDPARFRPA